MEHFLTPRSFPRGVMKNCCLRYARQEHDGAFQLNRTESGIHEFSQL